MINYPDPRLMNPLREVIPGIQTGMQLGGMLQRRKGQQAQPSDAIIADPGQKQVINPKEFLMPTMNDLKIYKAYYKKIKKLDEKDQKMVMNSLVANGVITDPIMREITTQPEVFDPEEVEEVLKSIANNSPTAETDVLMLQKKLGGENSSAGQAIMTKVTEAQQMQERYDRQRIRVLEQTIDSIKEYQENPKRYQSKEGVTNPQTLAVVQKTPQYARELASLYTQYPDAQENYYKRIQKKTYKPTYYHYVGLDEKTGERIPGKALSETHFKRLHPTVKMDTIKFMGKEDLPSEYMGKAEITAEKQRKEKEKLKATLPRPRKSGQKITGKIIKQYLEFIAGEKDKYTKKEKREAAKLAKEREWNID